MKIISVKAMMKYHENKRTDENNTRSTILTSTPKKLKYKFMKAITHNIKHCKHDASVNISSG